MPPDTRMSTAFGPDGPYHLFTTLTRLSQRYGKAGEWLSLALEHRMESLAMAALEVAVETEGEVVKALVRRLEEEGDRQLYGKLAKLCDGPRFQFSVALRDVALVATSKFLDSLIQEFSPLSGSLASEVSAVSVNLGVRLNDVGRYDEALKLLLITLLGQVRLAKKHPSGELLEKLATALNNLSYSLSSVDRREDAVLVMEVALESFSTLEEDNPGRFLSEVAMCLNNLSSRLAGIGRLEEAMKTAKGAVEHYRRLAFERSSPCLPELAGSLTTLAMRYHETGQIHKALAALQESERIFRELADDLPDSFLPDYAMCLTNLGPLLIRAKPLAEALPVSEQAVLLYRRLANRQRGAFAAALAAALTNASQLLGIVGRWKEALDHSQEAVAILRSLSEENPQSRDVLAEALDTLSRNLSQVASPQESLSFIEEALALRRALAAKAPELHEPRLAGSLGNYALRLAELHRHADAVRMVSEAIQILTPHFARYPDRFCGWVEKMMRQYLEACMVLQAEPDPGLLEGISSVLDRMEENS